MSKKFHVQQREFLNIYPTWRAYIMATVEDTSGHNGCYFELASCHDEIELHFSLATPEDRENSLHKANKLAEVVNAFRDAIEKEVAIINERRSTQQHARAASAVH